MIAAVRAARGRRPNTSQRTSPVTAAQAVSIDHRTSSAHAPANPEPVLNLVHGNSVASTATPSDAPIIRSMGAARPPPGAGRGRRRDVVAEDLRQALGPQHPAAHRDRALDAERAAAHVARSDREP